MAKKIASEIELDLEDPETIPKALDMFQKGFLPRS